MSEEIFEDVTPYGACMIMRVILNDDSIPPQKFYGLAKRNIIINFKGPDGKIYFQGADFKRWIQTQGTTSTSKKDYNKLAEKFM